MRRSWNRAAFGPWISAIGTISLTPRRCAIGVRWKFYDDNIRARDALAFFCHLHALIRRSLIVVLDRFNVHRSAIQQLHERRTPWLDVEWLSRPPRQSVDLRRPVF